MQGKTRLCALSAGDFEAARRTIAGSTRTPKDPERDGHSHTATGTGVALPHAIISPGAGRRPSHSQTQPQRPTALQRSHGHSRERGGHSHTARSRAGDLSPGAGHRTPPQPHGHREPHTAPPPTDKDTAPERDTLPVISPGAVKPCLCVIVERDGESAAYAVAAAVAASLPVI